MLTCTLKRAVPEGPTGDEDETCGPAHGPQLEIADAQGEKGIAAVIAALAMPKLTMSARLLQLHAELRCWCLRPGHAAIQAIKAHARRHQQDRGPQEVAFGIVPAALMDITTEEKPHRMRE